MMDDNVIYKDIKNAPGYKVGNDGSIWSCKNNGGNILTKWKKIKPFGSRNRGGLSVSFY